MLAKSPKCVEVDMFQPFIAHVPHTMLYINNCNG